MSAKTVFCLSFIFLFHNFLKHYDPLFISVASIDENDSLTCGSHTMTERHLPIGERSTRKGHRGA